MLSKSRNVMRYLKAQYAVLRLKRDYELAIHANMVAHDGLTGG